MVRFRMVGTLSPVRETERLKYYEEQKFDNWTQRVMMLNMRCGDNSFMLKARGGEMTRLYLFGKDKERIQVEWSERGSTAVMEKIADWNKFVVDLSNRSLIYAINNYLKGNPVTGDKYSDLLNSKTTEELEEILNNETRKRKEFLAAWDFVEFLKKAIDSGRYDSKNFRIDGNVTFNYSQKTGRWYQSYEPTRIYLTDDEPSSNAVVELFFDNESLDESTVEDGYYTIRGAVQQYDSTFKEQVFAPYDVVVKTANPKDELEVKKVAHQISRFKNIKKDEVFKLGMNVNLLNGSQRVKITEDDLTQEQKDSLLFGEITWDDIYRDLGTTVWGERVTQNVFIKPSRGYTSGRQETIYTPEMLDISYFIAKVKEEKGNEEDVDLFDDDDLFA